jgi:predicted DNA-binding transcriptional regulator YafY
MSRAERLLQLMQVLRRHRHPVSGAALALETGVSLRTLYRDIASLQAQGASIAGEAGVGYVLQPGFMLPPLMFTMDELEALVLGSRWVAKRRDQRLGAAAQELLAKVSAVLPTDLRYELESTTLLVGPGRPLPTGTADSPAYAWNDAQLDVKTTELRLAIRHEVKAHLLYRDLKDQLSTRTVWPFALGFFDEHQVLIAWCELRQDLRHFHIYRIQDLQVLQQRYPKRRQALLKAWREKEGLPTTDRF